jgi:hypothetical protein
MVGVAVFAGWSIVGTPAPHDPFGVPPPLPPVPWVPEPEPHPMATEAASGTAKANEIRMLDLTVTRS